MISLTPLRKHLAMPKTSWQLCLLAAIGGALSALLVILFTLSFKGLQHFYLNRVEDYTSLDGLSRFELPIIGSLLIIIFAWFTGYKYLRTGIPFVLHRLKVAHGIIPLRNTIHQFIGTVIALASGFSVGREGPAVHLGAACSSYIGSLLKLPFNSIRTLCACGIAAGISASFNTPIAAVIFVMEVILREYKVHIFIPVMIAAIIGSMITQHVFGPAHEFDYFNQIELTLVHYPSIVLLGIVLGLLAFAFNRYLTLLIKHSSNFHIIPRLLLAAFITGGLGFFIPYAMGTDISAVNFSLKYDQQVQLLLGLLIAKMVMTITALGLGIPGGIIGPILGIGAIAGTFASTIAMNFLPGEHLATDFALMGMAGFMAATLNAPLAALLAVVELSNQIEVVIPAMIVITSACVISGQFCNNRSIIIMQLEVQKLIYRLPPIEKSLQRIGVLGIMREDFCIIKDNSEISIASALDKNSDEHLIISQSTKPEHGYIWHEVISCEHAEKPPQVVPHQLIPLMSQSTLADAYHVLLKKRHGGVYIYQDNIENILGIVSFEQIRRYLLEGKTKI
ncbi:chloride channel protein [Colwelliaceae bacterium 6441]